MVKLIRSFFLLIVAAMLTYSQVAAQTRSLSAMKELAEYHLNTDQATLAMEDGEIMVFNNKEHQGFVVLSANPELPEVVGYSDTGYFNPDSIPSNMRFWMDGIKQTSTAVSLGLISAEQAFATASSTRTDVKPLLGSIMWDQGEPYNLHCPMDYDEHSVTGCGATALAQIMMFYKYPTVGTGDISYTYQKTNGKSATVTYDFSQTIFDWSKMRESYTAPYIKNPYEISESIGPFTFTGFEGHEVYNGVMLLIDTLYNSSRQDFSGEMTILIYDTNDKFIEASSQTIYLDQVPYRAGWNQLPITFAMPSCFADGTYRLYLGCRTSGSTKWDKCRKRLGQGTNYVEVVKNGSLFSTCGLVAECTYNDEEAEEVAELMFACGAALETKYSYDGSSVSIMAPFESSVKYFGYDREIFLAEESYLSTQLKNDIIIEELEAGRPVYLGGVTKRHAGHAFVADGVRYDTRRTPWFHINWGWNGYMNGYFLITKLTPNGVGIGGVSDGDYANYLYILGGFQPENNQCDGTALAYNDIQCNTAKIDIGGTFGITVGELTNASASAVSGKIDVFLKDENKEYNCGTLIDFSSERVESLKSPSSWVEGSYKEFSIPSSISDGVYEIVLRIENKAEKGVYGHYLTAVSPKLTVGNPSAIDRIQIDEPRRERIFDLFGRSVSSNTSGIVVTESGKKVKVNK